MDLPIFYAVKIARLPPVDAKHCDMSAVLIELQGLRKLVRDIQKLQEEVCVLRQQLVDMVSLRGGGGLVKAVDFVHGAIFCFDSC